MSKYEYAVSIPQEWIEAATDTYAIDEAGAAHILAAVLPLIAAELRITATNTLDADPDAPMLAWANGCLYAADQIWKGTP